MGKAHQGAQPAHTFPFGMARGEGGTVNPNEVDRETLASIFASRVSLAKRTEDEAAADAREEHRKTVKWVASPSKKEGSFLWFTDEFDLDAGAVRRAIQERRK